LQETGTPPEALISAQGTAKLRIILPTSEPLAGSLARVKSLLNVTAKMRHGEHIWDEGGVPEGRIWVRIDRTHQLISVFKGAHEIGTAVILYGAPRKPTPAGTYPILAKMKKHRSSIYNTSMPYTLRLTHDGISIHARGVREGLATHGCIGVPDEFARRLFAAAKAGDKVIII
jgi:hypothetical protein